MRKLKRIYLPETKIDLYDSCRIIFIPAGNKATCAWSQFIMKHKQNVQEVFQKESLRLSLHSEIKEELLQDGLIDIIRYRNPDASKDTLDRLRKMVEADDFSLLQLAHTVENYEFRNPVFIRYVEKDDKDCHKKGYNCYSIFELPPLLPGDNYASIIRHYLSIVQCGEKGCMYSTVGTITCPTDDEYRNERADVNFEYDSKMIMDEVKERIAVLRQRGVSEVVLNSLLTPTTKLSRLQITGDYRIFLPEYNNLEIKLTPLPKAVFLLFLRHEEGILFKYLAEYQEELMEIYEQIRPGACREESEASIAAICDPANNSINEKCARIREAFVRHFDERLAKHYFVTGNRGQAKRITLPRDLVIHSI